MKDDIKYALIGLATLLLIAKCASGGSIVQVNQATPKPTPTVTQTVTKTQVKTTEKVTPLPDDCKMLTEQIDKVNSAIAAVGKNSGILQDAGDSLLSAMERQDRKTIVRTTEKYSATYSAMSSDLSDLVGSSLQLRSNLMSCQESLSR